jgi:hypothetical protein
MPGMGAGIGSLEVPRRLWRINLLHCPAITCKRHARHIQTICSNVGQPSCHLRACSASGGAYAGMMSAYAGMMSCSAGRMQRTCRQTSVKFKK